MGRRTEKGTSEENEYENPVRFSHETPDTPKKRVIHSAPDTPKQRVIH